MERCDVLIVGGGPAGSTCATALVRAGLDVIVADKARFPRDKVCAGWITPAVVDELALDLDDYGRGRTIEPVRGFRIGRMGDRTHDVRYAEPMSYGIRRCEFDDYLLQRSGARLAPGHCVATIVRRDSRWTVGDDFECAVLVGAGGHFCPVARATGSHRSPAWIAAAECEFAMTEDDSACAVEPGVPELYYTRDLAGYGWAFRKGGFLNVGLGVRASEAPGDRSPPVLRRRIDEFVQFLIDSGRVARPPEKRMVGHTYLLRADSRRRSFGDGFVLVGDAAGLAYGRSGEGIRCAVESGILAARSICQALAGGSTAASALAPYAEALERRFGAAATTEPQAELVPSRVRHAVAGVLMRSPWFSRRVLLERWFLRAGEPALASEPPLVPAGEPALTCAVVPR